MEKLNSIVAFNKYTPEAEIAPESKQPDHIPAYYCAIDLNGRVLVKREHEPGHTVVGTLPSKIHGRKYQVCPFMAVNTLGDSMKLVLLGECNSTVPTADAKEPPKMYIFWVVVPCTNTIECYTLEIPVGSYVLPTTNNDMRVHLLVRKGLRMILATLDLNTKSVEGEITLPFCPSTVIPALNTNKVHCRAIPDRQTPDIEEVCTIDLITGHYKHFRRWYGKESPLRGSSTVMVEGPWNGPSVAEAVAAVYDPVTHDIWFIDHKRFVTIPKSGVRAANGPCKQWNLFQVNEDVEAVLLHTYDADEHFGNSIQVTYRGLMHDYHDSYVMIYDAVTGKFVDCVRSTEVFNPACTVVAF